MSEIIFPLNPYVGQTYIFENKIWKYNGIGWVLLASYSEIDPVFNEWINTNPLDNLTLSGLTDVNVYSGLTSGQTLIYNGEYWVNSAVTSGLSITGNTQYDTILWSGNTWQSSQGVIGNPGNGTYSDGLFNNWTPATPIGISIDKINEVLKGLAPPPSPDLSSSSIVIGGTTQSSNGKISFGVDNMISGYWYSGYTVGTFCYLSAGDGNVTGILANNVNAHSYSYPANSFNNSGVITIENIYSGITYTHSVDLDSLPSGSTYNSTVNGITITLSAASNCKFSDLTPFTLFSYRTGAWSISSSNIDNGFNYIQILYKYDNISSNNFMIDKNTSVTLVNNTTLNGLSMSGSKYLSGVRYHTSGTALYSCDINNVYRNTYYNNGVISFSCVNGLISSTTIPNVSGSGAEQTVINITNRTFTIDNSSRLLNASISAQVGAVARTLSRNTISGNTLQTISGILLDNVTDASTNTIEYFDGEGYRLKDTTYSIWTDITDSTNTWNSQDNLTGNTGLQVYNGTLTYPSINFSTITNGYAGNPNYTGLSGARTYIRKFYLGTGVSNMALVINGSGTGSFKSTADSSGSYIWIELNTGSSPGTTLTGWKDAYRTVAEGGCYGSTYGSSRRFGGTWGITFGTDGTAYSNGYVMLKITTNASISCNSLQLTGV